MSDKSSSGSKKKDDGSTELPVEVVTEKKVKEWKTQIAKMSRGAPEERRRLFHTRRDMERKIEMFEAAKEKSEEKEARPIPSLVFQFEGKGEAPNRKSRREVAAEEDDPEDEEESKEAQPARGKRAKKAAVQKGAGEESKTEKEERAIVQRIVNLRDMDKCKKCKSLLHFIPPESEMFCPSCGKMRPRKAGGQTPVQSYSDDLEKVGTASERVANFKRHMMQYSVRPPSTLNQDLQRRVHEYLSHHQIKFTHQVRTTPMENILRNLGEPVETLNCASRIANYFNGQLTAIFNPREMDTIVRLFTQIQKAYFLVCRKDRCNFLNKNYVLRQICLLCGWKKRALCFPIMKDRDTVEEADIDFLAVCKVLGWDSHFRPSI